MSVIAIPPRTQPVSGTPHTGVNRRTAPSAVAPTLTITFNIPLGGATLTPQASRLLDQVRELAERGDGAISAVSHEARLDVADPRPVIEAYPAGSDEAEHSPTLRVLAASRVVLRDNLVVPLTRLEYDLLLFLARNPRRVFTRLQLLGNVWGYDHAIARTVDVHVRRLRAKVGESVPVVTTVYGVGYRLADNARVIVDHDG